MDVLDRAMDGLCRGIKFGKTKCGGLPVPFNMDFLSPGTFNIFGCKLTDFDGLPILAVPTQGTVPVWPPFPSGAGGIFGGSTSQFRLYVSPTLTMGLGISLCFGPFDAGMNIKSPVGDIAGNCVVLATMLGPTCDQAADEDYVIEEEHADLAAIGACDVRENSISPIRSWLLDGPVVVVGEPTTIQSTLATSEYAFLK